MNNFAKRMNYQVSTAAAADIGTPRSKFYVPHTRKTTFNVGDLIPVGAPIQIFPGDSIDDFDTKVLARLSTAKFPTMDNAFVDFFAFFTPWRLLFDKTKEFFGENNESAWVAPDPVLLPSCSYEELVEANVPLAYTLWDYFGLPVAPFDEGVVQYSGERFNVMPFRGYKLIYNEFFRNQNTTPPLMVNTSGTDEIDGDYFKIQRGCRLHDLFSDCLPAPQKGPDVLIPGLASAPVVTSSSSVNTVGMPALQLTHNLTTGTNSGASLYRYSSGAVGVSSDAAAPGIQNTVAPANLVLDASAATIRSLRDAFQIQRIYERDARSGSRYTEYLRAAFDVVSPDSSLQRPLFLGTYRMSLNMSQVIQSSSSTDTSPLGHVAGLSKTWANFNFPAQGFTEHGYLYILALARTERSYYGGIHPMFTQLSRFDVYDPALGMISEQPVYKRELAGFLSDYNEVFGYKPPWEELRTIPSWVTGSFRPDAEQSLAAWTYVDYYGTDVPTLSTEWMEEDDANMARTLAYNSETQRDQILLDMRCDWRISRCVPAKGVPGLVDHF